VIYQRIATDHWQNVLRELVEEHLVETASTWATELLANWEAELGHFWQVVPKEMLSRLQHPLTERREAIPAE
jgi:glutamate synthase (NADPH/NADH) large chain